MGVSKGRGAAKRHPSRRALCALLRRGQWSRTAPTKQSNTNPPAGSSPRGRPRSTAAISDLTNAAKSDGVLAIGSAPSPARRFFVSGVGEQLLRLGVHARDDRRRRAGRREHAEPVQHLVALDAGLRHRRHVGQRRRALRATSRRARAACRLSTCGLADATFDTIDATCPPSRSGHRRADALVRHVHDVDAGLGLQQLHRQMQIAADAGRARS